MRNHEVYKYFWEGITCKNGRMNVSCESDRLISYGTTIIQKSNINGIPAIIVNKTKYSTSTSRHLNQALYVRQMKYNDCPVFYTDKEVPINTYDIEKYCSAINYARDN